MIFFVVVVFLFSNPHHQEQVPCLITGLQVLLVFLFLFVNQAAISDKIVETLSLACVAKSKEHGTRVKDHTKNGTFVPFFAQAKPKLNCQIGL